MTIESIERVYMRIEDVAQRLGVHTQTVRHLRQQGRIQQRYVGGRAFFRRDEIERFAATYDNSPGRPRQTSMRFGR